MRKMIVEGDETKKLAKKRQASKLSTMVRRVLRFLFPVVLLGGIGVLGYWFWTGQIPQSKQMVLETENLGIKLKEMVTPEAKVTETGEAFSVVTVDHQAFSVEIADTPAVRQKGLMHRDSLPKKQGMLFVFERSAVYDFWMPNVNFPLDIVWIDENFTVVDVKTVPPCEEAMIQQCPSYKPDGKAKYVLEVNANVFPGVIGDQVKIDWN